MPRMRRKTKRQPVQCFVCAYQWIPYGRKRPQRCANKTCRSTVWYVPPINLVIDRATADA